MTGFFCLYSCVQRATCAGSAPTLTNLKFRPSALLSCWSFWTYDAVRAAHDDRLLLGDVLLVLGDVLPVLEHGVRLAVRERLIHGDLCDLRDLDRAAEILLERGLRDVGVGRRSGPRLLVERDGPARRLRRARTADEHDGSRCDRNSRRRKGELASPSDPIRHPCLLCDWHYACCLARTRPWVTR